MCSEQEEHGKGLAGNVLHSLDLKRGTEILPFPFVDFLTYC